MLTTYPHAQPDPSNVARFGRFRSISLQFDDCTASSRALTAANWGNRTIRTATRRPSAPNAAKPPSLPAWGAGRTSELGCGASGRWPGLASEKSHAIRLSEVSTKLENVAIPTI